MKHSLASATALTILTLSSVHAQTAAPAVSSAPLCSYGKPHESAPEELSQFGFLIGDFDITSHVWLKDHWSPPRPGAHARWRGWYSMGGMMITDEWYDPDPAADPDATRGVNVRFYDDEENIWKMMWISTAGRKVQDLRAAMRDDKLTMWQVYPTEIDPVADFTVVDEDNWYRVSYVKNDAGEWEQKYKLQATRIPCE